MLAGIEYHQLLKIMLRVTTALLLIIPLAGCEPAAHVALERDFNKKIDYACIDEALGATASDVRRHSYQSDGSGPRGFARGTVVTHFTYRDPSDLGRYSLDIAIQPNGITHYWHQWGKTGLEVQAIEQDAVLPLLTRADQSIAEFCGLSFSDTAPLVGNG